MNARRHNPSITIHLPGRHLAVPDHGALKNTSQLRFSNAGPSDMQGSALRALKWTAESRRHTGFNGHVSPEEVLPVTPGESHSDTVDTEEGIDV